jgi:hypothetical protein
MSLTLTNSACKPLAVEEGTGGRAICVYSAWGPGTAISVIYRGKQVANTVIEVDGRGDLAIVLPFGDKIDLINAVNGRNSPAHAPVPAPGWLQSLTDALLGYVLHIAMHRWAEVLLVALAGFFAWLIREKTRRKAADKRARARRAAA